MLANRPKSTIKKLTKNSKIFKAIIEAIKEKKGENRPFHSLIERKEMLESIKWVDSVFKFDSDEELITLIRAINPDVYVIGSDYKDKPIVGMEYLRNIVFIPRIEKFSTTKIMSYEYTGTKL